MICERLSTYIRSHSRARLPCRSFANGVTKAGAHARNRATTIRMNKLEFLSISKRQVAF